MRAVAVLLVVVFHAGLPLPGGAFGVDVFFVISGFVITGVLASELSATGRVSLPGFYARRIKRLLPALALMVTCVAVLGTLASPVGAQRTGALTGMVASIFGANVYLANLGAGYFDVSATLNPLLHTWTLAVEEQFYLVFPALLLLSWWVGKRLPARVRVLVPVVAVATLSVLSLLWMRSTLDGATVFGLAGSRFAFYASPARAWEFGAGALLALLLPLVPKLPDVLGSALGALGVGLLALGIAPTAVGDPGLRLSAALLVVGGTSALIAAGRAANLFSRGLALAPFVWIGDLSYSWYLWHWPLIVFARAVWPVGGWVPVAAAAVSIVPAWLSLRLVENPIRRAPELRGRRLAALTAVCIAIPVAACAGLVAVNGAVEHTAALESWQRVERPHADGVLGCNVPAPLGERPKGLCTWHVPHARGTVVLVGDSNAGHFTEPVVRAAKRAGYDVTVATLWSCPFVDLRVEPGEGDFHKVCRHFFSGTLQTLERTHPSLVIMASRSDYYIEGEEVGLGAPSSSQELHDAEVKAALWEQGTRSVLTKLTRAGVPVLLVHPVPELPTDSDGSAVIRILLHSNPATVSRSAVDRARSRSAGAETRALAAVPVASSLDFENTVCGRTSCSSDRGGHFWYRDSTHLSVDGALLLTHRFYLAISRRAKPAGARR